MLVEMGLNMSRIAALPAMRTRGFWRQLAGELRLLFGRPPRVQFGALCYRQKQCNDGTRIEILLITSRDTGRWVIPKGWPMEGRTAPQVAEREAYEEAGMRGAVAEDAAGRFTYGKVLRGGLSVRCIVQVHAIEVRSCDKKFPERKQRTLGWFAPEEAAARVAEPGLKKLLASFDPQAGAKRR